MRNALINKNKRPLERYNTSNLDFTCNPTRGRYEIYHTSIRSARFNGGAQFKAKIGLEALREAKTVNEIAQENGVHPGQVGQWKKEIQHKSLCRGALAKASISRALAALETWE